MHSLLLFAAGAVALSPGAVVSGAAASSVAMEEVQVTASRASRSTREVSSAVTVVSEFDVERSDALVVTDFLRGQPGVFVQQTTPGQGIPIVRGLKGSEVLHLVDGIRLNNALFRNAPNQYPALVDPQLISRLEVVRGPASSLYGSDAMGGVVQFITESPGFDGEAWELRGKASARYGSVDDSFVTSVQGAAGNESFSASGSASLQEVGDREAGGGETLTPSGYRAKAAAVQLAYAPDDAQEWRFWAQYLTQPRTPRYDELNPGFGQTEPASEVFNFEPNDRLFLHGRYRVLGDWRFVDSLELHVAHQEITDGRRTRDTGSVNERTEDNVSRLTAFTVQGNSSAGVRHRLTWGAELYLDEVNSSRISTNIETGESEAVISRFPDGSTLDSMAYYLHDEFSLSPSITLNGGVRYSRFDIDLPPADRGVGANLSISDLTGNAGINWALNDTVTLVSTLGRGFRPPNIFDLGTLGVRPGNRFNIANPNLDPEAVVTLDGGVKLSGDAYRAEIVAFYSDYRDQIVSVPTGEFDGEGRAIVRSENLGEVELWGIEATGTWQVSDRWRLSGALNYTRGEAREGGAEEPADRVPPLNGRVSALYEPGGDWWFEAWSNFADRQDRLSSRDVDDPRINPDGTPGWATFNVMMQWQPVPFLELGLGVANILDKRYREHGSGLDAPGRNLTLQATGLF
ncbi:MAG: TonB-dependent receptor [Pseudomonadota bacterium]